MSSKKNEHKNNGKDIGQESVKTAETKPALNANTTSIVGIPASKYNFETDFKGAPGTCYGSQVLS